MEESSRVHSLGRKDAIFPPSRYRRGGAGFASTERHVTAQAATARAANGDQDVLAGLPALAALAGMFRCLIRWTRGSHHALALVSFNINEFRSVRAAYGREEGDKAISTVSSATRAEVDPSAVVRADMSKCIVVLTGLTDPTGAIEPVTTVPNAAGLRPSASARISAGPSRTAGGRAGALEEPMGVRKRHAAPRAGTSMVVNRSVTQL
jgi:GGDEF domain-containing protein